MQALLILEGALCILTAPARLQPPVRDPPAAQTHGVAAGHMGWSWGRGNTFQNGQGFIAELQRVKEKMIKTEDINDSEKNRHC